MLIENTLFGTTDKVQIAIDRLKTFEPPEGYFLAFSGGKDSWLNAEDVMDWWINGSDKEYLDENQLTFDDLERLREESEFE